MKKSKFSLLLILTLVFSLILAACSGGGDDKASKSESDGGSKTAEKQEVKISDTSEIPTMDTALAEGSTSFTYIGNVGEGLYRLDKEGKAVPALSDGEPQANEDNTVYTFKLRDSKWSNGEPVTANDFVFAWRKAIDPKTASPYGPYMMNGKIKGAQQISDAAAAKKPYKLEDLGVKAIDDKTLEVTLEKPFVFWEDLFAFPTFYPQNQKFVEEKGKDYASNKDNLLYNGPFVMTKWDGPTASEWVLEKNKDYWDADSVKMEKMTFNVVKDSNSAVNAFEAGELDITGLLSSDIVPQYEEDDRLQRIMQPTVFWLKLNQKNEALANVNIRKAISQGFNKDDLASTILNNGSVPANYFVPEGFVKHPETGEDFREINGDLSSYNLEEAQKAWEKGLKELGKKEVTIRYLGGDTEASKKTDEYIKNQLETNLKGLKIELESVPFAVRLERDNAQDYDIQMAGWGPDYGNALSFTDLWVTDGGSNRMNYSNKEYDKLVKDVMTVLGDKPKESFEAHLQLEKILLEDAAIAPVYQRADNILISDKVKGLASYNYGPDYHYQWMTVTE